MNYYLIIYKRQVGKLIINIHYFNLCYLYDKYLLINILMIYLIDFELLINN